ncbi:hypothetical protein DPMN_106962 [Dreissena polymorpha]|uniref:Uncharacterized protein n=1 Tax=Dreissena polymorpha TaxID=45954 RepID=A0A9D4K642_DREPO|nr:hypothetical protein DPMN_106962 [Dreissena polymorpha]
MLVCDCPTLLEVQALIPVSENWVSCSEMKEAKLSTLWKAPTKGTSGTGGTTTDARIGIPLVRVAAVHVNSGNRPPMKVVLVPMLTKLERETGETMVTILGIKVQISIMRDRSEADMVLIGESLLGGTYRALRVVVWDISSVPV